MPKPQMSVASGGIDDRPPVTVPPPGAAAPTPAPAPFERLRPTVIDRPFIRPTVWTIEGADGYAPTDPYVRRYWIPVLGPGAVADLLRLATAAVRQRPLPRPLHLATLAREGLVTTRNGTVAVRLAIPPVPSHLLSRLPTDLKRDHPTVR